MKVKVVAPKLAKAFERLSPVLKGGGIFPGFVLIEVEDGKTVELTAFSDSMLARVSVPAETIEGFGAALVEARHVVAGVKNQNYGYVTLEAARSYLKVTGERFELKTKLAEEKDFVHLADLMEADKDWCSKTQFLHFPEVFEMLKKVEYAVLKDGSRKALECVHFFAKNGKAVMEATDGRRLAKVELERDFEEFDTLIPPKVFDALSAIRDGDGEIDFDSYMDENNKLYFGGAGECSGSNGDWTLIANGSILTYPSLSQVIPSTEPIGTLEVDVEEFKRALKIGSGYLSSAQEETLGVILSFGTTGGDMKVEIRSADGDSLGSSSVFINLSRFEEKNQRFKVRARAKYIAQILAATEDDTIKIDFRGETQPLVFTYSVPAFAVLMPLRVN